MDGSSSQDDFTDELIAAAGNRYGTVPEWLALAGASQRAVYVYYILALNTTGVSGPSWKSHNSYRDRYGVSKDVLNRGLKEPRDLKAVSTVRWVAETGHNTSSVHWLWFDPPFPGLDRPDVTDAVRRDYGRPALEQDECRSASMVGADQLRYRSNTASISEQNSDDMSKNHSVRTTEEESTKENPNTSRSPGFQDHDPLVVQNHLGIRSRVTTWVLDQATSSDGKPLTPRERKQLRSQVEEWLQVGYTREAVVAAITASDYKTPNAVGGQLRKQQQTRFPKSWGAVNNVLQRALAEEANEEE